MALVMVGDIKPEKAVLLMDKYVEKTSSEGLQRFSPEEPKTRKTEYTEQHLSVSMPLFMIGFKETEDFKDGDELLRRELMTELLLDIYFGQSSSFYMSLYEKGLINASFSKETELEKAYGFSSLSGESKNPEEVYELVKNYIDDISKKDISDEDLNRAKKVLIGKNLKKFNSVENIGNSFIKSFLNGQNPLINNEIIESITKDELKHRLTRHFDTKNSVLSVILPVEE